VTIKNNPPAIVNLIEEIILICVIPGPNKPSLEKLNSVLKPLISEIQGLYEGMLVKISSIFIHILLGAEMTVHSFEEKQAMHATLLMNISDFAS